MTKTELQIALAAATRMKLVIEPTGCLGNEIMGKPVMDRRRVLEQIIKTTFDDPRKAS
jgi:hypothetical protein